MYIAMVQYFTETLTPLDQIVYMYDFDTLLNIASSSGVSKSVYLMIVMLFVISFYLLRKIQYSKIFISIFSLLLIGSASSINLYIVKSKDYSGELHYYCNANKLIYFIKSTEYYLKNDRKLDTKMLPEYIADFRENTPHPRNYQTHNFPFLYKKANASSKLSSYFRPLPESEKPNIIIIVVESLCHAISGKYSHSQSFTPFIDSLTQQSLYWRNALSTSERTFGVMPAVLASLPPGEEGFTYYTPHYPHFYALPAFLKQNGYQTMMFYGGWPGFTSMGDFVHAAGVDSIYYHFAHYPKMPKGEDNFTWGYGDEVLFRASFDYINKTPTPYFSLYLSLSTHTPFLINNQASYYPKTKKIIDNMPEGKPKTWAKKNLSKLSTFVMLDEELENFFDQYRKRPEFRNTIFVITGDHRGILFQYHNSLDKYHVPLLIYSPLLSHPQEFGGLVTHNDIFPALERLLENKYHLSFPEVSHSLGFDLDTSISFHSRNRLLPMRNSRVVDEYLLNDIYLVKDKLYKVGDHMQMTPFESPSLAQKMKKEMEDYRSLHIFSITNNLLVPPNLYYHSIQKDNTN
jgi:uncharacterized sulfatase